MKTFLTISTTALFTFCAIRFYNNGYSYYLPQQKTFDVELQIEEPLSKGDTLQVLDITHSATQDTIWIGYFH